ncbi:MAG: glycosyltransferase, partial [Planctomycetes bacterium]|nr:glycosyltransferase [Planctomycetota bacterium]
LRHRTIVYCDGWYDGHFRLAEDIELHKTEIRRDWLLDELFYQIAVSPHDFLGITSGPATNLGLLEAGYRALRAASENWCWGKHQLTRFSELFPSIRDSLRLVLPFTSPAIFDHAQVDRSPRLFFTTTMHNIAKKGYPELVTFLDKNPTLRATCIVRQPERLPSTPPYILERIEVKSVTKAEMIHEYHRAWLNWRVSREESSPLSVLESMICEVPQIVSPVVAEQIPLLEDGATGFIVDPDDGETLNARVNELLRDKSLRDRMGAECRSRASELAYDKRRDLIERWL